MGTFSVCDSFKSPLHQSGDMKTWNLENYPAKSKIKLSLNIYVYFTIDFGVALTKVNF